MVLVNWLMVDVWHTEPWGFWYTGQISPFEHVWDWRYADETDHKYGDIAMEAYLIHKYTFQY